MIYLNRMRGYVHVVHNNNNNNNNKQYYGFEESKRPLRRSGRFELKNQSDQFVKLVALK
jgi:hypothetical protein